MAPLRRSDQMLSSTSGGVDEETLFHLRTDEESKYCSGSTEWGPSSGELSLSGQMLGFSGDVKLASGESTASQVTMTNHYHSDPSAYAGCSETAAAVAGIPCLPSDGSNSYYGSAQLYSSMHSSIQTKLDSDNVASAGIIVSCNGSIPYQVEDDDVQLNWNPVEDVKGRIKSKIKFLKKSGSVSDADIGHLMVAEGIYSPCMNYTQNSVNSII